MDIQCWLHGLLKGLSLNKMGGMSEGSRQEKLQTNGSNFLYFIAVNHCRAHDPPQIIITMHTIRRKVES